MMNTTVEGSKRWGLIWQTLRFNIVWPISAWFLKKRFTISFPRIAVMVGQWGIPGWNFCHYCCVPAHKNLFFQGWWWCLQLSTGSWASPNISLDDYSNLEMCTFGRSSSFVCLFFVLFLSYHKASFHYFSRFQILALQRVFGGVW